MRRYSVRLRPDAIADLIAIYDYIAQQSGSADVALAYIDRLEEHCNSLEIAPVCGQARDDLRPGLRILPLDKNAVAAFEVDHDEATVTIINIFYGGRDYDAIIDGPSSESP